jgi:DNA adenine methylase
MRPLISYYGGKQRLASRIVAYLPPHTVYVEPFCGGAAVLFAKPKPVVTNRDHYSEVLNDHDQRIIAVYRVAQDPVLREALLERLSYTPYSRSEYQRARGIYHAWDHHDPVTHAWSILVNIQQSFASKLGGGWGRSVLLKNHAATWETWKTWLPAIIERLQGVYLECDDALEVIHRWDSPQTCFYIDPPYVGTDQGHYEGYAASDMKALIDTLDTCQGSFVLSGYAAEVPAHWECQTIETHCSASGEGKTRVDRRRQATQAELGNRQRTEYLWRVDRSAAMRPELQKLFAPKAQAKLPLFDD